MAVTDEEFTTHADINRAEFANRQILLTGSTAPGSLPASVGAFYLNTTNGNRYEKIGALDTDWVIFEAGGGSAFEWTDTTTNITAISSDRLLCDTSVTPRIVSLPITPNVGDFIEFLDKFNTYHTNNLTVTRNGELLMDLAEDLIVSTRGIRFSLIFVGGLTGWKIVPYNK